MTFTHINGFAANSPELDQLVQTAKALEVGQSLRSSQVRPAQNQFDGERSHSEMVRRQQAQSQQIQL